MGGKGVTAMTRQAGLEAKKRSDAGEVGTREFNANENQNIFKGPTNPATGQRDRNKKGVENPFGAARPVDPDPSTGLTAEDAAFKSAQLSEPQPFVSSNAEPAEGINNRIFDDVRTLDEEDIDTGEPSDAEIAQFSGGQASDDDDKVGQI